MTGVGSSCGACKFLRRRCTSECVFAPQFCHDEAAAHFAAVHRVFGASNVSKLLSHLPMIDRSEAAITISYEALSRVQDPIYGCVAQIFALQQQVASLQQEIETLEYQMASLAVEMTARCVSQHATLFSGNTSGNHDFYDQINVQLPSRFGLEDQNSFLYSNPGLLERLFEGRNQGIFVSSPWIDNGSNTY